MVSGIDKYILGISESPDMPTDNKSLNIFLTEGRDVRKIIRKRIRDSHKGTY